MPPTSERPVSARMRGDGPITHCPQGDMAGDRPCPFGQALGPWFDVTGSNRLVRVIPEVDESLRALLLAALPDDVTVGVEPGSEGVVATLRTIREDTSGLPANWEDLRDDRGVVVARRPPIRRYELRYAVTVHASSIADEHRLLDAMLGSVSVVTTIDPPYLHEHFAEVAAPVLIRVDELSPGLAERPLGLDLVVTAPMLLTLTSDVAAPPDEFELGAGRSTSRPATTNERPPRPLRARRVNEG